MQELSKDEVDEFLDFCAEKAIVSIDDSEWLLFWGPAGFNELIVPGISDAARPAEEFYPIVSSSPWIKEERRARLATQRIHPQLPAQDLAELAPTEGAAIAVPRPGESHKIYYSHDVLGSVSEEYGLVVERAARWCGVGDQVIYAVVERFERRFMRWKDKKGKVEKDSMESDSELEGSEEAEE